MPQQSLKPFSEQSKTLIPGSYFEHYSGKRYQLIGVGRHSETLEEVAIYQAQYGEKDIWVRPLAMFLETVTIDGQLKPRFKRVK